jgi:branched-chain amino acid transport system substrate-binding protein
MTAALTRCARRRSAIACMAALLVATAGCGTRVDRADLLAAAAGTPADGGGSSLEPTGAGGSRTDAGQPLTTTPSGQSGTGGTAVGAAPEGAPAGPVDGAGGGGAATPGASGGAAEPQCTGPKPPIVIASVGNYSGVLGAIVKQGSQAVAAWAASINATGGLNCHEIDFIARDDGGDPARHQSLVRQAVEQDGAIAFVYMGSPIAGAAAVDYIQQQRVPVIGEEGGNPWSCTNSMFFPVMTSCGNQIFGSYQVLARVVQGGSDVGSMACVEVPFCSGWRDAAPDASRAAGLNLVSNQGVSLAQPDYTSACISARDAGAQMMVLGIDSNSMIRIRRSCSSVGLNVPTIGPGSAYAADATGQAQLDGAWAASGVRFGTPDHPGYAEFVQTMARYAPGLQPTPNGAIGWVAAKVFELAAQNVSDNPTSEEILEGLWAIQGNDIGGLTKPLTYVRDQPVPAEPNCMWAIQIAESAWQDRGQVCW